MNTQSSYDQVADEYARRFRDEMDTKPFDRKMLDWLAEKSAGLGPICDMGCGPGQIARYLHHRGIPACGIDLSAQMVAQAQQINPEIPFQQGDMHRLTSVADASFGGMAAFYTLIHIPRLEMVPVLQELRRVLAPGGVLLAAFHLGHETLHLDEWWGREVSVDFNYYEREEMKKWLAEAGFTLQEAIERDPYPEVEYPSRRAYLFAQTPPIFP